MTQADALDILKTGTNVFITGPAGSGKTFVVNQYIKYLKEHRVPVGITASTGIAATHMGGVTIHSWAGIGVRDDLSEYDIEEIAEKSYIRKRIEETSVLIIDEVSMLHGFRLDFVDRVLRRIKKNEDSFGGMQVVLCGDFFQLPPVTRENFSRNFSDGQQEFSQGRFSTNEAGDIEYMEDGQKATKFVYGSDSWREGNFTICYLSEQYRQTDDESISILNEIRSGQVSEASMALLKSRFRKDDMVSKVSTKFETTRLFTHNINVDTVNDTHLAKVPGPEYTYQMRSKGRLPLVEMLKKSCLAPETLRLRKGARVMCVKNNFEQGYVNGTLGVVLSCGPGIPPVIQTSPSPEYPSGRKITIEEATWKIEDDGKVLAELTQYPLRLAWAITVHKSQGMSLDSVEVDLSRSFEPGMGYVALSRVRTLAGLSILGMNDTALEVHPDVLEYDAVLQDRSAQAEKKSVARERTELEQEQKEFLARVAPGHRMRNHKKTTFEITGELLAQKKKLKEIAKERGLTEETIIEHIEKLLESGDATVAGAGSAAFSDAVDISYLKKDISYPHFRKIQDALIEVADAQTGDAEGMPPLLSPIKSKVGANISFKEIRLARAILGYIHKKEE